MTDAYLYDHVRTPRGKGKKDGRLHQASPVWLLRTLLQALQRRGDLDTALQYLDTSIGIKSTWWNNWWRAQALAKKGRTADAIAAGEKALELGKGNDTFEQFFKADVQKTVDGWKKG